MDWLLAGSAGAWMIWRRLFFFQLLLFWIFDVPNFWLHFIYTIKSQNEMNLKIFQVFEILKSNRLQNKTKDRIFSWRDKLYLQIFGSDLIAVEIYIWGRNFFIKKYNTVSFIIMQKSDLFFANLNLYWVLRLSWGYTYTLLQGSLSSTIFLLKSVFSEISFRTWVQAVWDQKMGLWLADLFCLFIGGKPLELMYRLGSLFSWALRTREDRYNGTYIFFVHRQYF